MVDYICNTHARNRELTQLMISTGTGNAVMSHTTQRPLSPQRCVFQSETVCQPA